MKQARNEMRRCLVFAFAISLALSEIPFSFRWDTLNKTFIKTSTQIPSDAPALNNWPVTLKFKSHSQANQDMEVISIFDDMSNGYFVDLASNHYSDTSNTFVLDYYNSWNGVCVEPNPIYLVGLLSNRRCKVFTNPVSNKEGEPIKFRFDGGLGGIVGEEFDNKEDPKMDEFKGFTLQTLHTVTLNTILDFVNAPNVVEYLSLDVEGAEFKVLSGLNHTRYKFMVITIERPTRNAHKLLTSNGYRFAFLLESSNKKIGNFGECVYLHHTLKKFNEIMNSRHKNDIPVWNDRENKPQPHPYLVHPPWTGSYVPTATLIE